MSPSSTEGECSGELVELIRFGQLKWVKNCCSFKCSGMVINLQIRCLLRRKKLRNGANK
jgi:hypothetical protein